MVPRSFPLLRCRVLLTFQSMFTTEIQREEDDKPGNTEIPDEVGLLATYFLIHSFRA